jgi:hypothetical protein
VGVLKLDPVSAVVAALLTSFAGEAGKTAWTGLQRLTNIVRRKFAGDPKAEAALKSAEANPRDEGRLEALAEAVRTHADQDPQFRDDLKKLVEEAKQQESTGQFVNQVSNAASIGKWVQVGVNYGGMTF